MALGVGMFLAIGRAVTRRAWLVIVVWLTVAVGVIVVAPSISSITNSDQAAFLPASAESSRALALDRAASGADAGTSAVIVVSRADRGPLTDADITTVGSLATALGADRPAAVGAVAFDPRQMVSPNRAVATIAVRFTGPAERADVRAAVTALRHRTARALAGGTLTAGMTGQAAIVVDNKAAFTDAEVLVTTATLGLIVTLLLLIFRSPVAAALPLFTVGLVDGLATSLVSIAGHVFGFRVGQELPTMLTVVLFGIGTDYILFVLFRYRERRRAGDAPAEAVVAAVERVGEAIFSAGAAVIAAFGALVLASLGFFTTLGPALAIGVAVMLAAALTLVPAVVTVLGRWTFWPSRSATEPRAPRPATDAGPLRAGALARRAAGLCAPRRVGFEALGRLVARRPVAVIVLGVLALGGLAAGATRFAADYDPVDQLPTHTEAARAFDTLQRGFPAGVLAPTHVYLHATGVLDDPAVAAFALAVAHVPGVAGLLPPVVSADRHTVDVPVVLGVSPYTRSGLDLVGGPLRRATRAAAPTGTTVLIGGETASLYDVRATSSHDLRVVLPVAGALFLLILMLMLRAALAPVYLVAMVGGGFAATLGAVTLIFQDGLGHPGLQFALPIITYLFVTAIGTDYNILMTARLREELRDGRSPREAAALAIAHAGPSIAAAAAILGGTFGALLISGVPFFAEIGLGVMLGIGIVSFVVSILLVPAAAAVLGHAAWWPGRRVRPAGRDLSPTVGADVVGAVG